MLDFDFSADLSEMDLVRIEVHDDLVDSQRASGGVNVVGWLRVSSFVALVHVTRSVSNERRPGSSMRSTCTFPTAVKSRDVRVDAYVFSGDRQIRLSASENDAVLDVLDVSGRSVRREVRAAVVEGPRTRRGTVGTSLSTWPP